MLRVGLTNQSNTMVGAKATNALSESFKVISQRQGAEAIAEFKKGELVSYKENTVRDIKTGTTIIFKPDKEIFKEGIELDYTALRKQIQELAYLSPGMVFVLNFKDKEETITSQRGIQDYKPDIHDE